MFQVVFQPRFDFLEELDGKVNFYALKIKLQPAAD